MQQWNSPAIRTAIYRLEDSGFIQRRQASSKGSRSTKIVVIKLLRPPTDEDIKNLSFRRNKHAHGEISDGILEEDEEGDDIMRDIDLDLESDDEIENNRLPPQWSPDRLMSNLAFDAANMAGAEGYDSSKLRDLTMGKFWKRPTESYISRLTDNWEESQPPHLRHLALIRDTAVTDERRFVHYVYRTHDNYQKAVDEGQLSWEAVSKEAFKKSSGEKRGRPKKQQDEPELNQWGFHEISLKDLHGDGSSSLAECRASISSRRRHRQTWDNSLKVQMGYEEHQGQATPTTRLISREEHRLGLNEDATSSTPTGVELFAPQSSSSRVTNGKRKAPPLEVPLLTAAQRQALGLPARGRLGFTIEQQIKEHRRKTGDPTSLPDVILKDDEETSRPRKRSRLESKPRSRLTSKARKPAVDPPLFTQDFKKAHDLPLKGRLPQIVIDHYRGDEHNTTVCSECQKEQDHGQDSLQTSTEFGTRVDIRNETSPEANSEAPIPRGTKRMGSPSTVTELIPKNPRVDDKLLSPPATEGNASDAEPILVPPVEVSVVTSIATPFRAPEEVTSSSNVAIVAPSPSTTSLKISRSVLEYHIQGNCDKFVQREEPGFYFHPTATRPIGRGRPRKAFLAVFKSTKFTEFEWFQPDSIIVKYITLSGKHKLLSNLLPPAARSEPYGSHTSETTSGREANQTTGNVESGSQRNGESPGPCMSAPTSPSVDVRSDAIPSLMTSLQVNPQQNESITLPIQAASLEPVRTHPLWNAINAPSKPESEPYRSPYSATPVIQSPVQHPKDKEDDSAMSNISNTVTPTFETHERETPTEHTPTVTENEREPSVLLGQQELGYKRRPNVGAFSQRGVVLGRGNIWRLRVLIILEILRRCNGVFPHNGELAQPFYALWEERAGKNMAKPDRTTLNNTVKNMIEDPNNKIRKMTFRIPILNGVTTAERYILAWKSLPPTDARVEELRNNMIKKYPQKFYPDEIKDLIKPETTTPRKIAAPKFDPSIDLDRADQPAEKRLDQRIRTAARKRKKENAQKRPTKQQAPIHVQSPSKPSKRERLDTLNNEFKGSRGGVALSRIHPRIEEEGDSDWDSLDDIPLLQRRSGLSRGLSPASSSSSEDVPLSRLPSRFRPLVASPAFTSNDDSNVSSASGLSSDEEDPNLDFPLMQEAETISKDRFVNMNLSSFDRWNRSLISDSTRLGIQFYPNIGIFSTEFIPQEHALVETKITREPVGQEPETRSQVVQKTYEFVMENPEETMKKRAKRVRFADTAENDHRKKQRLDRLLLSETSPQDSQEDFIDTSNKIGVLSKRRHRKSQRKSQKTNDPTLLERLTGLTGNPDDPIYVAPKKKRQHTMKLWNPSKRYKERKEPKSKPIVEDLGPAASFKKLLCTLVIASCMSTEEGIVDWNVVSSVYTSDRRFDLERTKKVWSWVQDNMSTQVSTLTAEFQNSFLEAYEKGRVASIDDPNTYDWAALVRWALRTCEYPEPPLPSSPDALQDFTIEESQYKLFDRKDWQNPRIAHVNRVQRVLKYAYGSALHSTSTPPPIDDALRARSWIRANTATPQTDYNGNRAHDKLQNLGNPTLERVVADLVDHNMIRMRKLKRLLPGRNFDFTALFARDFRRSFDVSIFMDAVKFKKALDATFANEDLNKRVHTISRTAGDGAVMGLLTLVNDGKVRLIPRLPPVNNTLKDPSPRLSVWGFSEGDYVHRCIDRKRLLWNVDVVPTDTYQFGNPLYQSIPQQNARDIDCWNALLEPPLPGKNDPSALLPIWSTIDGDKVTWPWWYRILNLVLQALMFQPGASASEIHRQCPGLSAELFEVELVLKWLMSVNAARQPTPGTFEVQPGFWAVFGDELIGQENDWFGEHVKRNKMPESRQPWRAMYNLRSQRVDAVMRGAMGEEIDDDDDDEEFDDGEGQRGIGIQGMLAESNLQKPVRKGRLNASEDADRSVRLHANAKEVGNGEGALKDQRVDVVIVDEDGIQDADADAEGEPDWQQNATVEDGYGVQDQDVDAEGEPDDEVL